MTAQDRTLNDLESLVAVGLVAEEPALRRVEARYSIAVTSAMADLIDRSDPNDPIARQFIPDPRELVGTQEEREDPIADRRFSPVKGLVHRYPDRVLLKLLHVCPVYCRFCFRREMVGPAGDGTLSAGEIDAALAYIAGRPEIWEIVLTGGDPLMLSARRIAALIRALERIPHLKIIRWHSRVPIVDPARVAPPLVSALRAKGKTVFIAIHANHVRELTPQARAACARLIAAGFHLVSQSVLLKGVNNSLDALESLMRGFVEAGIKPYYLHHADLAPGTSHFRTSIAEGRALMAGLRGRLSGLCQPTYVIDSPDGYGKSPIGPDYLSPDTQSNWRITDYRGAEHVYRE
jgi:lysine 2,3-aminomutase